MIEIAIIVTSLMSCELDTEYSRDTSPDVLVENTYSTAEIIEIVLASGTGFGFNLCSTFLGNFAAFWTGMYVCQMVGPVGLPLMVIEIVSAAAIGTLLSGILLKEDAQLVRNMLITSGTTLVGIVVGGAIGFAYIYPIERNSGPEHDTNPWGIWAGVIPGAMIGSMILSSITGSILGAYTQMDQKDGT